MMEDDMELPLNDDGPHQYNNGIILGHPMLEDMSVLGAATAANAAASAAADLNGVLLNGLEEDSNGAPEEPATARSNHHSNAAVVACCAQPAVSTTAAAWVGCQSPRVSGQSANVASSKSWLKLNVGGKLFLTTRQTLCRESGSFMARLSQEDHSLPSEKDESGSYLIDRDSDYFSSVLNYLRHGKLVLDHGLSEEGLREEAEFYNLPRLIALCNERIAEREKQKKSGTKHVYRVLQCHEDELTNVISAMSDGWKFEQLVPIGHPLHASESGHPEYLCVVSREYPIAAGAAQLNELSSDRAQFLQKKAMNG